MMVLLTGKWNCNGVGTCVGPQALTNPLDLEKGEEAANIWKLPGALSGCPSGLLLPGGSNVTVPSTNSHHTSNSLSPF